MGFYVIIPARYASSRLPGKPLIELAGKSMIAHVYEKAQASGAKAVYIATDDERIMSHAVTFTENVIMTSAEHTCGTDRIAEAMEKLSLGDNDIIVNLQGDEPLMPAANIAQVAGLLETRDDVNMSTLCTRIHSADEIHDPHVVKTIFDSKGCAMYFSRATIPYDRDAFLAGSREPAAGHEYYRHLGIYAYRCGFLKTYVAWPKCLIEEREALEQLRVLWHGEKICLAEAEVEPGPGVDTESDLKTVETILINMGK